MDTTRVIEVPVPAGMEPAPEELESLGTLLRAVVELHEGGHVVLTIPRLLRPLFRKRRELLTELRMTIITVVTNQEEPPPPVLEILRVAEQGDGWGVPADWE